MNIDKGEFFVVKRGFKHGKMPSFFGIGEQKETEDSYDRSYYGMVFIAREVCGEHIAALCVHQPNEIYELLGKTVNMNTTELELWPVTNSYARAFNINVKKVLRLLAKEQAGAAAKEDK